VADDIKWSDLTTKLIMHGKMAAGGYLYVYEINQIPEISFTKTRKNRKSSEETEAFYNERTFKTVRLAFEAYLADKQAEADCRSCQTTI